MDKKVRLILDELRKEGVITSEADLLANVKPNLLFDYMVKNHSNVLSTDIKKSVPNEMLNRGELLSKFVLKYGHLFLNTPQIIITTEELKKENPEIFESNGIEREYNPDEPMVFIANHHFRDDILASLIAAKKRTYFMLGNLPHFFNTLDGILTVKNGTIIVNRKLHESRRAAITKSRYLLENGKNILIFPEGVWNKSPNELMQAFYTGFYRIAKKEDGTFYPIVPVVHYIRNTYKPGKDNPIYTVVDEPIYLDGMDKEDAIEYIRTRMMSIYWLLMEKYGKSTREELLYGYKDSQSAWEDELTKRVSLVKEYDFEVESTSEKKIKPNSIEVWEPVANLPINKNNAIEVIKAREKVLELKRNDFQHRF